MAVPIPNKFLTPAILAAGALLIAAAPPSAVAPDGPAVVPVCAPPPEELMAEEQTRETPDAAQQALIDHLSRRFLIATAATDRRERDGRQGPDADHPEVPPRQAARGGRRGRGAGPRKQYVYRTGTLEAGLQFYNGAWRDGSAHYAHKVMAERDRLEQVIRERGLGVTLARGF